MTKRDNAFFQFFRSNAGMTTISILLGLLVGAIVLMFAGYNPINAYYIIITGVLSKPKYIAFTIIAATPLIMTGLSVAFAFRTGLFNIGAEGQFIIGALVAALVGTQLSLPPVIHVIVIILLAGTAAGLWGGLAGYLKAKFGVHEVISTIMLNWIALYLNNFIVNLDGIARDIGVGVTKNIANSASTQVLVGWKQTDAFIDLLRNNPELGDILRAPINLGIVFAILMAVAVWYTLKKTTLGYELRAVGHNTHAAEYGGINVKKNIIIAMAISGMLAGLAGAFHVTGNTLRVANLAAMEGFGFDGIAVALIGGTGSIGAVLGGFLFGILKYGGTKIQPRLGAPTEIINIVIGSIVFFVAMPKFFQIMFKTKKKKGGKTDA